MFIDLEEQMEVIWNALFSYRNDCIPEGVEEYDEEWSDIATAMAHITEALGIKESMDDGKH